MQETACLPDSLVAKARAYAKSHKTTLSAIVRGHLVEMVAEDDPLLAFSQGKMTKEAAMEKLGLRDYAGLLVALGDADLPLPALPDDELDRQADVFAALWSQQ